MRISECPGYRDGGVYLVGHGCGSEYTFEIYYNQEDYNIRMKQILNNLKLYRK